MKLWKRASKKSPEQTAEPKKRHYFATALLIGILIIAVYIGIVALDIRIDIINPPDEVTEIPLDCGIYYSSNAMTPDINVLLTVRCNGTLAVGKPVELIAKGYFVTPQAYDTNFIQIGFRSAHAYPPANDSTSHMPAISLVEIYKEGNGELSENSTVVQWRTSGDYPVYIARYANDGYVHPGEMSGVTVHIEPASTLSDEKSARINLGLTFAFMYFAFIEAFSSYVEHRKNSP